MLIVSTDPQHPWALSARCQPANTVLIASSRFSRPCAVAIARAIFSPPVPDGSIGLDQPELRSHLDISTRSSLMPSSMRAPNFSPSI